MQDRGEVEAPAPANGLCYESTDLSGGDDEHEHLECLPTGNGRQVGTVTQEDGKNAHRAATALPQFNTTMELLTNRSCRKNTSTTVPAPNAIGPENPMPLRTCNIAK